MEDLTLELGRKAVLYPCMHAFCTPCLQKWIRTSDTVGRLQCPICRVSLGSLQVVAVLASSNVNQLLLKPMSDMSVYTEDFLRTPEYSESP